MAYEPTVWKSGDTITSAKLNKLENGLAEASGGGTGGNVLMINITSEGSTFTMDKTYAEIKSAFMSGLVICIVSSDGGHSMALVTFVYDDEEECDVDIFNTKYNTRFEYICSSVNDYPVYVEN